MTTINLAVKKWQAQDGITSFSDFNWKLTSNSTWTPKITDKADIWRT